MDFEFNYGTVVFVLGLLLLGKQVYFKAVYPEVEQHGIVTAIGAVSIALGLLIGGLLSVLQYQI